MIVELGHFALVLALSVAVIQSTLPMWGAWRRDARMMAVGEPAAVIQLLLVGFAFAALTYAFVVSDFSLSVVTANSHTDKPMLYKISGVWGNHEGSLLLWVLILAVYGAAVARFGSNLPDTLKARVISVQGMIGVAFLLFMLFTSNPFWRMDVPPMNGQDLNPLLQDPGLAFHPPFLYLGYVGLSMAFSFAVAALIEGRVDAAWARWVRPWTLAAWVFLTIGIALGSWWAYYELGWGGFWFWDPVENASFMPWLLSAALLHSAIVVEKRESLKAWTILLAIMAFGFSLIGTFIVRSGVITSVHAFANDPERGVFILMILGVFTGGALLLFMLRASAMEAKGLFAVVSRESALIANNILLAVSAFVVFIGTIWPLAAEMLLGRTMSVGEPFFNAAFTPFFVALALILPLGAMLAWKRADASRNLRSLWGAALLAVALGGLAFAMQTGRSALGPVGAALGAWVVFGALTDIWSRTGRGAVAVRLARLTRLPRADWGKMTAHSGLGITVFAVAAMNAWKVEDIRIVQIGDTFPLGRYEVTLNAVNEVQGPNYVSTMADMTVMRDGAQVAQLFPEKRIYPVAGMPTTEAAIDYGFLRDIYLVIGDPQKDGGWAVRSYVEPFANWLWGGAILMALGGFLSLSDRRYRVAAGARKVAAVGVPAE
ncbi:MAG: heme lyase CcmF/NrfE family subunit [Tabrizicola sp.]|uniref:heme lyase CcmF/NrfE family subunit n=1 Tax=Tabrizicola sp. TaxID=2005166 RepID=UPI002735EEF0|nr:heme lyase CcmF/NrfE family subunit [Tabrizicola sp.]MDP3262950.1 heme lyase CcmF/NrfE family subunit [Tabrizicola sp.]MDP3649381.1 heme lyase CcmF/NrfE family subunit [Paracoccaceae bacterium]MDZ4069701.1 heme lyase CcmF/NrfE family subunit [Tabrizicola sp.]